MPPIIDQTRPDQTRPDQTRPDQTRPDQTNYDLLYDKDFYGEALYRNHFADKKLSFRIIENCIITQNGIAEKETPDISNVEYSSHPVIFIGGFSCDWGDFLTLSMSRLWFMRTEEYRDKFSDYKIMYLTSKTFSKMVDSNKKFLDILGIDFSKFEVVTSAVKYDKVIVPDPCFYSNGSCLVFTREYAAIMDCIRDFALSNLRPSEFKKVYFSYSAYHHNRTVGEERFEKFFSSKGYKIIYPERLSLEEQLSVLTGCESFASTVGSCSHNIVFLRDDTEVILIPRTNFMNPWQAALNHVHKLNINYIDSSFSIFVGDIWGGPFLFFISSNLRKFFHDEDTSSIVYASDFKKYLRMSFGYTIGKTVSGGYNSTLYKYYSVIAPEYFTKLFETSWIVRFKKWLKSVPALRLFFKKLIR